MIWPFTKERDKWLTRIAPDHREIIGLPAMDARTRELYEQGLPRNVLIPRFTPERQRVNYWMPPHELLRFKYVPGQIILGKIAQHYLGYMDDRPQVTVAGPRAGKSSTILVPNLALYPGSMLVLDPKGELAADAELRRVLGHKVHVLDPFGQSGQDSSQFNPLAELDPTDTFNIVDDVSAITHALIINEADKTSHWINSSRELLKEIILLTLTLPMEQRNLVSVREFLTLTHPRLVMVMKIARAKRKKKPGEDERYFDENKNAVEALLRTMVEQGSRFGGVLAGVGNRFLNMAPTERGGVFSTAAAQTDFLDSLGLRRISTRSDFSLGDLRGDRPLTVFLCLGVRHLDSHYRWLRLIVQLACNVLEKRGLYPRDRAPILFLMEEFAILGKMDVMERAAAYLPGFGVKLWAILQGVSQLKVYGDNWENFLGSAGLVQCFANGDRATLDYLTNRLERLVEPFELRTAFARRNFSQLLLFEGEAPAAALRLEHGDVENIRKATRQRARMLAAR